MLTTIKFSINNYWCEEYIHIIFHNHILQVTKTTKESIQES